MGIQKKDREYERFLDQISDFIFVEDEPEKADILFVPGNGFPQMSIEAARLWKEGMAPWILPSGKYSIGKGAFAGVQAMQENYPGPYQTEWEFMRDVLRKEGVPEEVILREDAATFTYQNAINSRKVTDAAGIRVKKAIICCKAQHARRCKLYYQYLYPQTTFLICLPMWESTGKIGSIRRKDEKKCSEKWKNAENSCSGSFAGKRIPGVSEQTEKDRR